MFARSDFNRRGYSSAVRNTLLWRRVVDGHVTLHFEIQQLHGVYMYILQVRKQYSLSYIIFLPQYVVPL